MGCLKEEFSGNRIKALAKIPDDERESVVGLFTKDMSLYEYVEIIAAYFRVPPATRKEFTKFVKAFCTDYTDENQLDNTLRTYQQVPDENKIGLTEFTKLFVARCVDAWDLDIIKACGEVPPENRKGLPEFIKQLLLTENMNNIDDLNDIIKVCGQVSPEARKAFCEFVEPFLTEDMSKVGRAKIIVACGEVPVENRAGLLEFIKGILENMNVNNRAEIIKTYGKVSLGDRKPFHKFVKSFCAEFKYKTKACVQAISVCSNVLPIDRKDFKEYTKQLFTAGMSVEERIAIMELYSKMREMSLEARENFMELVAFVTTDNMNGEDRARVIKFCSEVLVEDRELFKELVKLRMTERMNGQQCANNIEYCGREVTRGRGEKLLKSSWLLRQKSLKQPARIN